MASDAMRAEFEKEVLRRYPNSNLARSQDGYAHTATHSAVPMTYASIQMLWEVWQAARRTPAAEVAGSSDSSMPVVAWCDLSNPLNNEAFAWPGTLRPATHTCALYTAPPPTAEVEKDAAWMSCESRRPWVVNSLRTRAKDLRANEKKARTAFRKDYMGEPARYFADACGDAAAVFEARLAALQSDQAQAALDQKMKARGG